MKKSAPVVLAVLMMAAMIAGGCARRPFWWDTRNTEGEVRAWAERRDSQKTAAARASLRIDAEDVCVFVETIERHDNGCASGESSAAQKYDGEVEILFNDEAHDVTVSDASDETVIRLRGTTYGNAGTESVMVRLPEGSARSLRVLLNDTWAEIPTGPQIADHTEINCSDSFLILTSENEFEGVGIDARLNGSFCVQPDQKVTEGSSFSVGEAVFASEGDEADVSLDAVNSFVVFGEDDAAKRLAAIWEEQTGDWSEAAESTYAGPSAREQSARSSAAYNGPLFPGVIRGVENLLEEVGDSVGDLLDDVAEGFADSFE